MTLAYLASPYTLAPDRRLMARKTARLCSRLILSGVHAFSPIVHGHFMSRGEYGELDPLDGELWQQINQPYLEVCEPLIVAHMDGWAESKGVAHEIAYFVKAGKPIFDLDPETLKMVRRP